MNIILTILIVYIITIASIEYNYFIFFKIMSFILLSIYLIVRKSIIYCIVFILVIIIAITNYNYNSISILKQYNNEEISFKAKIVQINKNNKYKRYHCVITDINDYELRKPEKTILYLNNNSIYEDNAIIKGKGNVKEVFSNKNNLVFNYKKYLFHNEIQSNIYCDANDIEVIKYKYSYYNNIKNSFRNYVEGIFYTNITKENANIVLAVLLGDRTYLNETFLKSIRYIGLAHLFAVSGLHIGILYYIFIRLFRLIGLSKKKSLLITCILLWIYGFFIGFPVSVLRTLFMFTIVLGSDLLYRKNNSLHAIFISSFILLIVNPFWIFDVGFQLSFIAALSLIIFSKYIYKFIKTDNKIITNILVFIFLEICILPILAYHFNYIPVLGIIYNIFFIPLFTIILIVCFVLLLIGWMDVFLVNVLFNLLNYSLFSMNYIILILDNLFINGFRIYSFNVIEFVIYYLYLFILFYINKIKVNKIRIFIYSFFALFILLSNIYMNVLDDQLYINVVDVGQGLSTLIEYKDNNYIIDAGSNTEKMGEYTLLPYLEKRGKYNIKALFISHWHKDHFSAANTLIENININKVYSGYINNDVNINSKIDLLHRGDKIIVDNNFIINVLWPGKNYHSDNENNMSQVLLINYYGYKILFTGDIEKEVEKILLDNKLNTIDILVVPHHGSDTSSTFDFINSLSPKYSVISYGKNNYNIPSNDVINRYNELGSVLLSTFIDGEINFVISKNKITYSTYTDNSNGICSYSIQNTILSVIMILLIIYYVNLMQKNEEIIYELFTDNR